MKNTVLIKVVFFILHINIGIVFSQNDNIQCEFNSSSVISAYADSKFANICKESGWTSQWHREYLEFFTRNSKNCNGVRSFLYDKYLPINDKKNKYYTFPYSYDINFIEKELDDGLVNGAYYYFEIDLYIGVTNKWTKPNLFNNGKFGISFYDTIIKPNRAIGTLVSYNRDWAKLKEPLLYFNEIKYFNKWINLSGIFKVTSSKQKVFLIGNHNLMFENEVDKDKNSLFFCINNAKLLSINKYSSVIDTNSNIPKALLGVSYIGNAIVDKYGFLKNIIVYLKKHENAFIEILTNSYDELLETSIYEELMRNGIPKQRINYRNTEINDYNFYSENKENKILLQYILKDN